MGFNRNEPSCIHLQWFELYAKRRRRGHADSQRRNKKRELDVRVHTTRTRCNGRCKDACVVIVYPEGTWYHEVDEQLAEKIVASHLQEGQPVEEAVTYTYYEKGMILQNDRVTGVAKDKEKQTAK